jgi:hypothetical protein
MNDELVNVFMRNYFLKNKVQNDSDLIKRAGKIIKFLLRSEILTQSWGKLLIFNRNKFKFRKKMKRIIMSRFEEISAKAFSVHASCQKKYCIVFSV